MTKPRLLLALLALWTFRCEAAPTGHLAFIQNGSAVVQNAATGKNIVLPRSRGAQLVSISPSGETIFFVAPAGTKTKVWEENGPLMHGFSSRPPYKTATPLLSPLREARPFTLRWSRSGTTLWASGTQLLGAYTPATRNFRRLSQLPDSVSSDGKLIAWAGERDIRVRGVNGGREKVVFSVKNPAPLFAAIKAAKNPKKLADLEMADDPDLWKDLHNWDFSAPALAPDGKRLYFACNAGGGSGAAGNSTWAIFAADLVTGKLAVLSSVGAQFGRMPHIFEVSPDGKRLLLASSVHSSAIDNPCFVLVVDLLTQKSREILENLPEAKDKSNFLDGAVWSPDGRYMAASAYFYDLASIKDSANYEEPPDSAWMSFIFDAATGKAVRRVRGARGVSWGR